MAQVQTRLQSSTWCLPWLLTCCLQLGGVSQARAAELAVIPLDGPSASATEIHSSSNTGHLVGTFWDIRGAHGLLCTPPLNAPCSPQYLSALDLWFNGFKAVSTQIQSITTGGRIAGFFADGKGASHGVLCTRFPANLDCHQVDVTIDSVVMANTLILGIQEQDQFVGSYRDLQSRIHGFLYTDGSFSRIDVPGALATVASGMTTNGKPQDRGLLHGREVTKPRLSMCAPGQPELLYHLRRHAERSFAGDDTGDRDHPAAARGLVPRSRWAGAWVSLCVTHHVGMFYSTRCPRWGAHGNPGPQ